MSTVCYCGHPTCPAAEHKPERCAAACCDCLRAEVERLKAALREVLAWEGASRATDAIGQGCWQEVLQRAREALGEVES